MITIQKDEVKFNISQSENIQKTSVVITVTGEINGVQSSYSLYEHNRGQLTDDELRLSERVITATQLIVRDITCTLQSYYEAVEPFMHNTPRMTPTARTAYEAYVDTLDEPDTMKAPRL